MRKTKGLSQAYDVQNLCHQAIMQWKQDRTNDKGELVLGEFGHQQLRQLVAAFTDAQDRVRIQRGKPLPGALRPEKKTKVQQAPANAADLLKVLEQMPSPSSQDDQPADPQANQG